MTMTLPQLEEHTLTQGQYTIHYVAAGNPQHDLVVLLHPAFGDHTCFNSQIGPLAERYRVVAIDMIGHGKSQQFGDHGSIADMRSIVPAIIAREGHTRAHLVGVSLGALIAQDVALTSPALIRSLTVIGGYPIGGAGKDVQRAQMRELLTMFFLMIFAMPRLRRYVATAATHSAAAREQFYRSAQSFTRRSFRVLRGMDRVMRPAYQPLQAPLLILVGEHERKALNLAARDWHTRRLYEEDVRTRFWLIDNAGHCANMDNPAECNAWLLDWLREV